MKMDEMLNKALEDKVESDKVDFKEIFSISSKADWCELIKDIVAMANSGGGILLIGLRDNGLPSGHDVSDFLEYDPANITNKLFSFTGKNFSNFTIKKIEVENQTVAALIIGKVSIAPLVFVKTGDYLDKNGKQKQAFANGMVYFRHGAKSEPCTSDDLQRFIACEVDNLRNSWLSNIRKVVEAPDGAQIIVLQDNQISSRNDNIQNIRLVDDPDAPAHQLLDINKTHPYRTKDIVELVNKYLGNQDKITTHTIISIKHVHNIDKIRRFYYRPHHGTASYSQAFVEWLIEQFEKDNTFFSVAKEKYRDVVVKQNMKRKLLEKKS